MDLQSLVNRKYCALSFCLMSKGYTFCLFSGSFSGGIGGFKSGTLVLYQRNICIADIHGVVQKLLAYSITCNQVLKIYIVD